MQGTIKLYLKAIGLEEYQHIFEENEIGPQEFLSLTKDDLKELFPEKLGPRIKIFNLIQNLQSHDSNLSCNSDQLNQEVESPDPKMTVNDFEDTDEFNIEKKPVPTSTSMQKVKAKAAETKTNNDEKWKKVAMRVAMAGIGVTAVAGAALAAPVILGGFVFGGSAVAVGALGSAGVAATATGLTAGSSVLIGTAAVAGTTAAAAGGVYLKTRSNEKASQTTSEQSNNSGKVGLIDPEDYYDDEDLLGIGLTEKDIPHSGLLLKNNSKATQTRNFDMS
jgi:hypothetical protein